MNTVKVLCASLVGLLAACSSGSGPTIGPLVVATITLAPADSALLVGESVQLAATLRDGSGNVVSGRGIAWSSENPDVVTIASTGNATAVGAGNTRVRASVGAVFGTSNVSVTVPTPAPIVSSVTVAPVSAVAVEGGQTQFTAVARDVQGNTVAGRVVQWFSGEAGIAPVDGGGMATSLRPGTTTITARVDGTSAVASLRVEADHPFELVYALSVVGGTELHTVDIDDPAAVPARVLPAGRLASQPTASPDGGRLAFAVMMDSDTHVWSANRDGSGAVQLTTAAGLNDQPAWSPDGGRIAYRHRPLGGGADIWIMNAADGSGPVSLTADQGATSQSAPAWSPTQGGGAYRIAYSHSETGNGHLWTMRDDGSDKRQITSSTSAYDDQPCWSPDGTRLVFQRTDAAVFGDLYVVDAQNGGAGSLLMPLAGPLAGPQFSPKFSPDGRLIAFSSRHEGGDYQIYTVWADGTRLARRTFGAEDHSDPAWVAAP